jgi:hypothetical protein
MKVNGREIQFHTYFLSNVKQVRSYIRKHSNQSANDFVVDLNEFVFKYIPMQPFAHPEFQLMKTYGKVVRKAIFRKKWNVIYKIGNAELLFVALFHSKRNAKKLKFPI